MKKIALVVSILVCLLVVLSGCQNAAESSSFEASESEISKLQSYSDVLKLQSNKKTFTHTIPSEPSYEIYYSFTHPLSLSISNDGIEPKELHLKAGENVKITVHSDIICTFVINGYGIVKHLERDSTTELEFNSEKPGIYRYECKQPFYHYTQKGLIFVE